MTPNAGGEPIAPRPRQPFNPALPRSEQVLATALARIVFALLIPLLVPSAAGGEEPENGPRAPQVAPESPTRAIDAAFEQWLYGAESPHAVEAARRRVTFDLRERIADLDAVCRLTDEQRSRLALAGEGDIRKLFDRTDRLRVRFRHDFRDGQKPDTQSLTEGTLREWAAIREDPFESGSFFYQMRQRLLTDDQSEFVVLLSPELDPMSN